MKIILNEDVKNLGRMGEVFDVSDGYARNYLIPKKLASEANTGNLKEMEHHKTSLIKKAEKIKTALKEASEKLSNVTITIKAKAGEEDKLFGAVTSKDIAEALKVEGFDIDKKKILLEDPIKRIGEYTVDIKIHSEISSHVKVIVVPEASL
jgi:large subunit ribosomal protein L9